MVLVPGRWLLLAGPQSLQSERQVGGPQEGWLGARGARGGEGSSFTFPPLGQKHMLVLREEGEEMEVYKESAS